VPFRYDRHPDHLAVNRAVTAAYLAGAYDGSLTEYFVYYRWRLLPGGDLRRYVRPDGLVSVDIRSVAGRKREALACFASQTTRYYAWQTRPILTSGLLDEECRGPEVYLRFDASRAGAAVFTRAAPWIRIAHRLEPKLQKCKYYAKATVTRLAGGRA
jgi:LmbE family N-acetylglucosaminyl deacetylase